MATKSSPTASAASSTTAEMAVLCIPLVYTYLSRPTSIADKRQVLFEASPEYYPIWRDSDIAEPSGQFNEDLKGRQLMDCLPRLRKAVEEINSDGKVECKLNETRVLENTLTVMVKGEAELVTKARSKIYNTYHRVERRHLGLSVGEVFEDGQLNSKLCLALDEISQYCGVSIALTDFLDKVPYGLGYHQELSSESAQKPYHIMIYGDQDAVQFANTKICLALDDLANKVVDSLSIPLSLQPLIWGPNLGNIRNILIQSNTQIYRPTLAPELLASQIPENLLSARNLDEIYISGNEANVLLARQLIKSIQLKTRPIFKDCVVSFAKIDLFTLEFRSELESIMERFGTFIQLPHLGAARSLIRVQGPTAMSVESTITELMMLSSEIYASEFWVHLGDRVSGSSDVLKQPALSVDNDFVDKVTAASRSTIHCLNGNTFEIVGRKADTKRATSMLKSLPGIEDYKHQVRYKLELSIQQRDFIGGKKNGKIIRIMNNANVWIKFLPFNEYNFYITLVADNYSAAAAGIQLLEDELPSEVSFYIPETYHKQVIGAGGLTIQSIMRKYNVFIKFSNDYDIYPNGFCHGRPENVLIRCPAKNAKNIAAARQELLATVRERADDHCNTFIHISRSHRRILLSEKCGFVHEVESKTNTVVMFPEVEPYDVDTNDVVEIRGLGNTSEDASRMIKALLPEDYVFKIAYSSKFSEIVNESNAEFYGKIVVPFKVALNIETQVFPNPLTTDDESRYHTIVLSFAQEHSVGLEDVIQVLTAFLREKELNIIDRGELRTDPVESGSAAVLGAKRKQTYFESKQRPSGGYSPPPSSEYEYRERPSRYDRPVGAPRSPTRSASRSRYSARSEHDYRPEYRNDPSSSRYRY